MGAEMATDEVTDEIASIEMHRQEIEKESGLAAARDFAFRKLQELLRVEQELLQQHGPGSAHFANVEAVNAALSRIKSLTGFPGERRPSKKSHARPPQGSWRKGKGKPAKARGRRTMGRGGPR